jgi:hypothetical protein
MVEFELAPEDFFPTDEEEAERERAVKECADNGGHEWELELEHPEEGEERGEVALDCIRCPAGIHDVYPDGHELIYLEFDGVTVEGARHNSPVPLVVPVTVDIAYGSSWTACGMEHYADLIIGQRGPARPVEVT